ncbi:MAG: ATP adenylyltransferase family protein [Gammaproteobacteria bacterium]
MLHAPSLWTRVIERTNHAVCCGAVESIETKTEYVEEGGIRFIVRILARLNRKARANRAQHKNFDPFLPYDTELFIAELCESHVCLLNKFTVVDHHLLIVTRAFEEQEALLNRKDFDALWPCMAEIDGLAFYNGGQAAGASQRHKHLQFVPLPLGPHAAPVPVEPLLAHARFLGAWGEVPDLGFKHGLARLDPVGLRSKRKAADRFLGTYRSLLEAVGIAALKGDRQSAPYNLLITRRWMLLVPRSQECFDSISINALGFAGALLVKTKAQMDRIKQCGPLSALRSVAAPIP